MYSLRCHVAHRSRPGSPGEPTHSNQTADAGGLRASLSRWERRRPGCGGATVSPATNAAVKRLRKRPRSGGGDSPQGYSTPGYRHDCSTAFGSPKPPPGSSGPAGEAVFPRGEPERSRSRAPSLASTGEAPTMSRGADRVSAQIPWGVGDLTKWYFVSRPHNSWRMSRSAASGWQGARSAQIGNLQATSSAASRTPRPGVMPRITRRGTGSDGRNCRSLRRACGVFCTMAPHIKRNQA